MANDTRGLDALINFASNDKIISDEELLKLEYINIDIDLVEPNKLNTAPMSDIEELTTAITEQGLKSPLVAYKNKNNTYTLLSGHRRRLALLNAEVNEVPVIVVDKPKNEREERKALIIFNAQRQESDEDINAKMLEIAELYDLEKENDPSVVLGRKSEYIVSMLGINISSRTVERRLKAMREEDSDEDKVENKKKSLSEEEELFNTINSSFKKINKLLTKLNYSVELKEEDKHDLKTIISSLQSDLNNIEIK